MRSAFLLKRLAGAGGGTGVPGGGNPGWPRLLREGGLAGLALGLLLTLCERVALGRRSGHVGVPLEHRYVARKMR
ncbi:hypothetical protein GCM10023238_19420 [Streptomyces heliomycini]